MRDPDSFVRFPTCSQHWAFPHMQWISYSSQSTTSACPLAARYKAQIYWHRLKMLSNRNAALNKYFIEPALHFSLSLIGSWILIRSLTLGPPKLGVCSQVLRAASRNDSSLLFLRGWCLLHCHSAQESITLHPSAPSDSATDQRQSSPSHVLHPVS